MFISKLPYEKCDFRPLWLLRAVAFQIATLVLLSCGTGTTALAQQENVGSVTGVVTDSAQGNPLPGANIRVPELEQGVSADQDGRFELENVPVGTYKIVVSYIGREQKAISVTVESDQTASVDISLAGAATGLEGVTVSASPIVGSQASALARQKAAPMVMNVIASDQVGKFPDQNAAAALSRVPGVAVQRDQGQARYVNLRGTPRRWTRLAMNGMNIVGSEGRVVRFDEIPAPIISSVEVTKAVPPNQPSSAVAGLINIETATAFDNPGFHVSGEVAPGYMGLSENFQYNASVQASQTWGETLGVVFSASRYNRNQVTDNIETDYSIGPDGSLWPTTADYRVYYLERTNNAFSGRLDFRPSEKQEFFLSSTYVEFNDTEQRNQYVFNLSDAQAGFQSSSNSPMQGKLQGVSTQSFIGPGYFQNSTWTTMAGGDSQFGAWDISYRGSYTRTNSTEDRPVNFPIQADPLTVEYDYSDPNFPSVDLSSPTGSTLESIPQTDYEVDLGYLVDGDTETNSYAVKVDFQRSWSPFGISSEVQFGGKFNTREKSGYDFGFNIFAFGPLLQEIGASSFNYENFLKEEDLKSNFPFFNRYDVQRFDVFALENKFRSVADQLEEAGLYDQSDTVPDENKYTVREDIYAGYVMNTWTPSWGSVLAGVRLEHVGYDSEGFQAESSGTRPVKTSTGDTELFPSLHVNVDLTEELRFRIAGTRTVSRAGFSERRPSVSIDDANQAISGGNPSVDTEKAWGVDLSLEYYLPQTGILSVSGFNKWISNPLFSSTTLVEGDRFDAGGLDRSGYLYSATLNGQDGVVRGVEFNYFQQWHFLPGPLGGFGLQTNATFLDSEFTTPPLPGGETRAVRFPGTSNTVFNGSLFFERYGLSARISYQWRDDWIDSLDPSDGRSDVYWDNETRLSVSLRYSFSENYTIFADANNLTDELGRRYRGFENKPVEIEGFGRRYQLGVRVNY